MDIILNKLPNVYENENKTLWKYEDNIDIFNNYNQFHSLNIDKKEIEKKRN